MSYNDLTLHHFQTAANAGTLEGPDVYRGIAGSRAQGTWVQFDVQVRCGTIQVVRFLAHGCPHTIAVAAWIAEKSVGTASRMLPEAVERLSERFAVPIEKRGRLLIIEDAWVAALAAAAGGAIE